MDLTIADNEDHIRSRRPAATVCVQGRGETGPATGHGLPSYLAPHDEMQFPCAIQATIERPSIGILAHIETAGMGAGSLVQGIEDLGVGEDLRRRAVTRAGRQKQDRGNPG